MQSSKIDRIKDLVEQLNAASESYYAKDQEIMSNYEYDKLYDELVELEKETGVTLANSPTVNVGYEAVDELPKERHESPMLSLGKTKSREELRDWLQGNPAILSWKLDGLTIVLTYREGKLAKAVTRGNGEIGEVITNNARTFKNLPLNISYTGELILRGEAVITYSDFEKINGEIADAEAKYKNPRNLCSGSVRQLNNEITARRNVRFFAFTLVKADGVDFHDSKESQFAFLQEQGFVITVPYRGIYVTLLSLSNIKQMIYMRVAVETMVIRDFSRIATPLMMEDIYYMLRKQKALIQTPDFKPEQFYRLDAQMHAIWFEATKKKKLWDLLQEQQLHYTRFRMLDFVTETDFTRIIQEHEHMIELLEKKDIAGMEMALKDHLYFSMKRMRHQIDVEYREYFEEEETEGKFDI